MSKNSTVDEVVPGSADGGKSPAPGKAALSIAEFCEAYGVGATKAYEEIAAGRLTAYKAGQRTLIRIEDADAWLNSLPRVAPKSAA